VIDAGLAKRYGLRPGDPLVISDFRFRVAGITRGQSAMLTPFVFIGYDGLIDLFLESEIAPDLSTFPLLSFLLVELAPGAQAKAVAQAIERAVPEADVLTADELAAKDVALGQELFGPIMGALIGLAYLIGILVVGLIVYADTIARRRAFGVMKALGFRLRHMLAAVAAQTLMLLVLAWPLGVGLAFAVATGIEALAPVYRVYVLEPAGLAWALAGVLAMALAGAALPLRVVARADPTIAFQGE
jgi:putative ABC transport system permease protein